MNNKNCFFPQSLIDEIYTICNDQYTNNSATNIKLQNWNCNTPSTSGNTETSNSIFDLDNYGQCILAPCQNKLDESRRIQLNWCSSLNLTKYKMFDAFDVLEVFESVIDLNNLYTKVYPTDNYLFEQTKTLINEIINRVMKIKYGECLLKLAQIKSDSKIKISCFNELNDILLEVPDLVTMTAYMPFVLFTLLVLTNNGYQHEAIPCKMGVLRIMLAMKNKNESTELFKIQSELCPFFSNAKKHIPNNAITDIVLRTGNYYLINPILLLRLAAKAQTSELNEKVTIIGNNFTEVGYILNTKK